MPSCRQQQVVVLRPPAFQDRNPQFLNEYGTESAKHGDTAPAADAKSVYTCWRVPHHLTNIHWQQLLKQHSQHLMAQQLVLVQPGSRVMQVLGKFERRKFIHVLVPCMSSRAFGSQQAAGTLPPGSYFHLPRFNLEFELQTNGRLASKDFKDYVLACEQQLVSQPATEAEALAAGAAATTSGVLYTLPGLVQYLVLQHQPCSNAAAMPGSGRSSTLVLVPAGQVVRNNQGTDGQATTTVGVALDARSGAQLKVKMFA